VSRPETATLSSGTVATIAAAARAIYRYDASLGDVYARAEEQFGRAAGENFAAPGTIAGAIMLVAQGQRRHLR
jgi:hypothetical protein